MADDPVSLRDAFRAWDGAGCTLAAGPSSQITNQTRLIVRLWLDGEIGGDNASKTWVAALLRVGVSKKDFEETLDAALLQKGRVRERNKVSGLATPFCVRHSPQELAR
jgi:hypothetical protein